MMAEAAKSLALPYNGGNEGAVRAPRKRQLCTPTQIMIAAWAMEKHRTENTLHQLLCWLQVV
eukprot:6120877-Pyramimonas_sp.AAC.1